MVNISVWFFYHQKMQILPHFFNLSYYGKILGHGRKGANGVGGRQMAGRILAGGKQPGGKRRGANNCQPSITNRRGTANVGRVAHRKKKFNQFYCLITILGFKRNSKFPIVKKNLKPYWRASGTQAENFAVFWLNWLCVSGAISKMA